MLSIFKKFITDPLEAVIGRRLSSVDYWPMRCDEPFELDRPNDWGMQAVLLRLDGARLFAWPGWAGAFREEGKYFGLELTSDERFGPDATENLVRVRADSAVLWAAAMGRALRSASVWGHGSFPHALFLGFGRLQVVLSTGTGDRERPDVGDGDDLLVMSRLEFQFTPTVPGPPMDRIWHISAPDTPPGDRSKTSATGDLGDLRVESCGAGARPSSIQFEELRAGRPFPSGYRALLLRNNGGDLIAFGRPLLRLWPVEELGTRNDALRSRGLPTGNLAFAEAEDGDVFAFDRTKPGWPIVSMAIAGRRGEPTPVGDSFDDFLQRQVESHFRRGRSGDS